MFGGKRGGLQAEEHHPNCEARRWQHHVVGCFAAGATGALHKIDGIMRKGKLCGYIKATSQDISQEVKAWFANGSSKWKITPSILPKLWQNGQQSQDI